MNIFKNADKEKNIKKELELYEREQKAIIDERVLAYRKQATDDQSKFVRALSEQSAEFVKGMTGNKAAIEAEYLNLRNQKDKEIAIMTSKIELLKSEEKAILGVRASERKTHEIKSEMLEVQLDDRDEEIARLNRIISELIAKVSPAPVIVPTVINK